MREHCCQSLNTKETLFKIKLLGQNIDACHISATRISAPKRLAVVVNKNIVLSRISNGILELRCVSLRYVKHRKMDLWTIS